MRLEGESVHGASGLVSDHLGMGSRVIVVAAVAGEEARLLRMPANLEKYTVMKRAIYILMGLCQV